MVAGKLVVIPFLFSSLAASEGHQMAIVISKKIIASIYLYTLKDIQNSFFL
jgi:hypothetical protein